MTYVIAEPCIGVKDRACVDECPVDCIYEGDEQLFIHPEECVDCDACLPVPLTPSFRRTTSRRNGRTTRCSTRSGSSRTPRHRVAPWKAPSPPRRSAVNRASGG